MTRVYIPATLQMLQRLVADGELHAVNGTADWPISGFFPYIYCLDLAWTWALVSR